MWTNVHVWLRLRILFFSLSLLFFVFWSLCFLCLLFVFSSIVYSFIHVSQKHSYSASRYINIYTHRYVAMRIRAAAYAHLACTLCVCVWVYARIDMPTTMPIDSFTSNRSVSRDPFTWNGPAFFPSVLFVKNVARFEFSRCECKDHFMCRCIKV